jgi:hypothetical protein
MNYRIKKYEKGFVVEVQKTTWYGKKYWTHFISVAGISSKPWFHSSYEYAEINLLNKIKWQTIRNSK